MDSRHFRNDRRASSHTLDRVADDGNLAARRVVPGLIVVYNAKRGRIEQTQRPGTFPKAEEGREKTSPGRHGEYSPGVSGTAADRAAAPSRDARIRPARG